MKQSDSQSVVQSKYCCLFGTDLSLLPPCKYHETGRRGKIPCPAWDHFALEVVTQVKNGDSH